MATQRAYCWGNNAAGQLGSPVGNNAAAPVEVRTADTNYTFSAIAAGSKFTCGISDTDTYCWWVLGMCG